MLNKMIYGMDPAGSKTYAVFGQPNGQNLSGYWNIGSYLLKRIQNGAVFTEEIRILIFHFKMCKTLFFTRKENIDLWSY